MAGDGLVARLRLRRVPFPARFWEFGVGEEYVLSRMSVEGEL